MLTPQRIIYLHGLGGSPSSSKAMLIEQHFGLRGIQTVRMSLNIPSLQELSPVRAVESVIKEIGRHSPIPIAVIGSSFGAFVALHSLVRMAPHQRSHVTKIVLLAPLLEPWDSTSNLLNAEVEHQWRLDGSHPVLNMENNTEVPVHYRFVEELKMLNKLALAVHAPTYIVHGTRDLVVHPGQSERFASQQPHVTLQLVDDDHRLLSEPGRLVAIVEEFICKR